MMPKISVIVPCYNAQRFIGEALNSLMRQTYTNLEIICADDFSSDNTLTLLNNISITDPRIKIVINNKNLGVVGTLNKLIKVASADYILRMDSDDIFEFDRVEKLYEAMMQYGCDIVSSDYSTIDLNGNFIKHKGLVLPSLNQSLRFVSMFNSPLPSQALFTKHAFDRLRFDSKYKVAEDYYLFTNLLLYEEIKAHNVQKRLYRYRINPGGLTKTNTESMNRYHILIAKEYINNVLLIEAQDLDFWMFSKRMVNLKALPKIKIIDSLNQISYLKNKFLKTFDVSKNELREIHRYYGQYMMFTYYCILRDSNRQGVVKKVLPVVLRDMVKNAKFIFNPHAIRWILRNI